MDYIPSILQFGQSLEHDNDDALLRISCPPYSDQLISIQRNHQLLPPTPSHQDNLHHLTNYFKPSSSPAQKRKAASSSTITFGEIGDEHPKENKKKTKKIVHRDIERQRRQEMATLYASLRSHLPLEYLKGKRSISDHVNQTVNYIKHLQSNIQELHNKRDDLKNLCENSCSSSTSPAVMQNYESPVRQCVVLVRPCGVGVEVVVNTPMRNRLSLSRALDVLVGEGLGIVNCISAQVNERLIYTIESEVNDGRIIDMPELQRRLTETYDRADFE